MNEIYRTLLEYDRDALERALAFYNTAPDGQYDGFVADLLRAILRDVASGREFHEYCRQSN